MTPLIKTRAGAFVNLNNVFAIDYHIDDQDEGEVFAVATPAAMRKDEGVIEMELFRGTEAQVRKWLELFDEANRNSEGMTAVLDLTSLATQTGEIGDNDE